jgi:hypothetical protein
VALTFTTLEEKKNENKEPSSSLLWLSVLHVWKTRFKMQQVELVIVVALEALEKKTIMMMS